MKKKDLARQAGVHASYITKILKTTFVPPLDKAEAIGKALGDPGNALRLARYSVRFVREVPLELMFKPLDAYLDWLASEQIYTRVQADFLSDCFRAAAEDYQRLDPVRSAVEQGLFDNLAISLSPLLRDETETLSADPISEEVKAFLRIKRTPMVRLDRVNKFGSDSITAALVTGMFDVDKQSGRLQLRIPLTLFPVALLRPASDTRIGKRIVEQFIRKHCVLLSHAGLTNREIWSFLTQCHRRFRSLPAAEQQSIWALAKYLVNYLWDVMHVRFEMLQDVLDYYDVKHLYMRDEEVSVFATTSGLIVPREFFGDLHSSVGTDRSRPLKNPYRQTYFEHGIIHGCRTGCRVWYQWDSNDTARELINGKQRAASSKDYESQAASILSKFLELESMEITASEFSAADWRRWLTLTSNRFAVISARNEETKKIVHGLIFRTNFLNQMIKKAAPNMPLLPELSRNLYKRSLLSEPIKKMGIRLTPRKAEQRARLVLKDLLTRNL